MRLCVTWIVQAMWDLRQAAESKDVTIETLKRKVASEQQAADRLAAKFEVEGGLFGVARWEGLSFLGVCLQVSTTLSICSHDNVPKRVVGLNLGRGVGCGPKGILWVPR